MIKDFNKEIDKKLENNARKINDMFNKDNIVFLSGGPGTGKSSTIEKYKELYRVETITIAPTHVAAINVGGLTIHSGLRIKPGAELKYDSYASYWRDTKVKFNEDYYRELFAPMDMYSGRPIIIIDEVSMISDKLLTFIIDLIRKHGSKSIKIILAGDFYQLAPIDIKGKTQLCFKSDFWKENVKQHLILTENLRNDDKDYNELLRSVKNCDFLDHKKNINQIQTLRNLMTDTLRYDENMTYIVGYNSTRKKINDKILGTQEGKKYEFKVDIMPQLNKDLIEQNKDEEHFFEKHKFEYKLKLKEKCKVIITTTDKTKGYYNGLRGTFVGVNEDLSLRVALDDGRVINISKVTKYKKMKNKITGKKEEVPLFKQYPLLVAYAITVHKSQGMSIDGVIAYLSSYSHKGQLYVAMSRAINSDNVQIYTGGFVNKGRWFDLQLTKEKVFSEETYKKTLFYRLLTEPIVHQLYDFNRTKLKKKYAREPKKYNIELKKMGAKMNRFWKDVFQPDETVVEFYKGLEK